MKRHRELFRCPDSSANGRPASSLLEPQVRSTENLVLKQLLAGSFGDNVPRGEDIVAGGHLKDRVHFLFNEQDGDTKLADLSDLLKYLCSQKGGKACRGLIDAQQFGLRHKCPAYGEHLVLST